MNGTDKPRVGRAERAGRVRVDEPAMLSRARQLLAEDQFDRLLTLPWSARRLALARLDLILAWIEDGRGRGEGVEAYAEDAHTDVSRFYRYVKEWEKTKSLRALGVGADAPATRRSKLPPGVREAVQEGMRLQIRDEPAATLEAMIARGLEAPLERAPGRSALYAWARAVREEARREPFGTPFVALTAVGADLDGSVRHEAAVAIDRGTGLPLGVAVATNVAAWQAYRLACADAARRLHSLRLAGVPVADAPVQLRLAPIQEQVQGPIATQILAVLALQPRYVPVPPRAAERIVRDRLGGRLGHLELDGRPLPWREGAPGDAPTVGGGHGSIGADRPRLTVDELSWTLARAVSARQGEMLAAYTGRRESPAARGMRLRVARVLETLRSEPG